MNAHLALRKLPTVVWISLWRIIFISLSFKNLYQNNVPKHQPLQSTQLTLPFDWCPKLIAYVHWSWHCVSGVGYKNFFILQVEKALNILKSKTSTFSVLTLMTLWNRLFLWELIKYFMPVAYFDLLAWFAHRVSHEKII